MKKKKKKKNQKVEEEEENEGKIFKKKTKRIKIGKRTKKII